MVKAKKVVPLNSSVSAPIIMKLRVSNDNPVVSADESVQFKVFDGGGDEVVDVVGVDLDVIQDVVGVPGRYSSSTCCFWDRHPFSTRPVALITDFDSQRCDGWGHFCSPECAIAWSRRDNRFLLSERWRMQMNMQHVYGRIIHAAPDWQLLKSYGGGLTIEQFRKLAGVRDCEVVMNIDPFSQKSAYGTVVPRVEPVNASWIPLSESHQKQQDGMMRLKRTKPIGGLWSSMNMKEKEVM